jgi:hypothetical protein
MNGRIYWEQVTGEIGGIPAARQDARDRRQLFLATCTVNMAWNRRMLSERQSLSEHRAIPS